jgi:glycerol kinase
MLAQATLVAVLADMRHRPPFHCFQRSVYHEHQVHLTVVILLKGAVSNMPLISSQYSAIVKSKINSIEIGAIGFSTQRSVTVPVDKNGKMTSWQDARTTAEVAEMKQLIAPNLS